MLKKNSENEQDTITGFAWNRKSILLILQVLAQGVRNKKAYRLLLAENTNDRTILC